jgi:uncharacterized protein (TIGR03067 family)
MSLCRFLFPAIGLSLIAALATAADKEDAVKAEQEKLKGVWQATKWIDEDGDAAPAEETKNYTMEFNGEEIIIRADAKDSGKAHKVRIDPSQKPKWIDIETRGLPVAEGIYKLEEDELTICIVSGERNGKTAPRPTEFEAKKKEKYTLFVLKKRKQ